MKLRDLRRQQRGSALVEIAITLPILLAMILGIFEFSRAWNIQQVITNASREGARQAVLLGVSVDSVEKVVASYMSAANLNPANASVNVVDNSGTGTPASVEIGYPYESPLFGKVASFLTGGNAPDTLMLRATTVMRNEL